MPKAPRGDPAGSARRCTSTGVSTGTIWSATTSSSRIRSTPRRRESSNVHASASTTLDVGREGACGSTSGGTCSSRSLKTYYHSVILDLSELPRLLSVNYIINKKTIQLYDLYHVSPYRPFSVLHYAPGQRNLKVNPFVTPILSSPASLVRTLYVGMSRSI